MPCTTGCPFQSCFLCLSNGASLWCMFKLTTTSIHWRWIYGGELGRLMGRVNALMSSFVFPCHQSERHVILCLLMQLQLSPYMYIQQHLLNDRFLFRIWAEEIVRRVCIWLHEETSKEPLLILRMSSVRTRCDF